MRSRLQLALTGLRRLLPDSRLAPRVGFVVQLAQLLGIGERVVAAEEHRRYAV